MRELPDLQTWSLVSPFLDRALDLESSEREAWLAQLMATQPEIAARVRALLAEHAQLEAKGSCCMRQNAAHRAATELAATLGPGHSETRAAAQLP